ncbi:hypothetical protein T05_2217 [Trichinella murrelli]|uniref:Uncharacterized protein n=1 Tax=Trichinella murrelli TaxID=144512 RepID=A0A0V0TQX8_9BILA|nr:hypothetical protein T05_2217 [Trichinella murrelli]
MSNHKDNQKIRRLTIPSLTASKYALLSQLRVAMKLPKWLFKFRRLANISTTSSRSYRMLMTIFCKVLFQLTIEKKLIRCNLTRCICKKNNTIVRRYSSALWISGIIFEKEFNAYFTEQLSSVENRMYMLSVFQMITVRGVHFRCPSASMAAKLSRYKALLCRLLSVCTNAKRPLGAAGTVAQDVTKSPPCKQLTSKETATISGSEAQTCGTGQACFIEQSTLHHSSSSSSSSSSSGGSSIRRKLVIRQMLLVHG